MMSQKGEKKLTANIVAQNIALYQMEEKQLMSGRERSIQYKKS